MFIGRDDLDVLEQMGRNWNEWGEDAYLEEDTEDKDSYLKALKDAVRSV